MSSDIGGAVAGRDMLVVAVPSAFVAATTHAVAARAVDGGGAAPMVVCASKGLEPGTGATMAEVIAANLPGARVGVLSGPSFAAGDRARAAGRAGGRVDGRRRSAAAVQGCFGGDRLRIYTSDDVTGVCVGGALKNVIAIAVGCCDGFGFGDNARAALITRGLAEMGRLAERMGGHALTLAGLAGLGDLVLTCTGDLSRNRQVGLALARGDALAGHPRAPRATSPRASAPRASRAISPSGSASTCRSRARSPPSCTTASRRAPPSTICSRATSAPNADERDLARRIREKTFASSVIARHLRHRR